MRRVAHGGEVRELVRESDSLRIQNVRAEQRRRRRQRCRRLGGDRTLRLDEHFEALLISRRPGEPLLREEQRIELVQAIAPSGRTLGILPQDRVIHALPEIVG